jgi:hypothetical protein
MPEGCPYLASFLLCALKDWVTVKNVGMDPVLFTTLVFPAMAIFLKGISIALGGDG